MTDTEYDPSFYQWVDLKAKAIEVQEAAARAAEKLHSDRRTEMRNLSQDTAPNQDPYDAYEDIEAIEEIPSRFGWLAIRESTDLDELSAALGDAAQKFYNTYIASSTGYRFDAFGGHFIDGLASYLETMDEAAVAQGRLAEELLQVVGNMQCFLNAANHDVAGLADRAIEALDDIADGGSGSSSDLELALVSLGIGVVAAVVGAPTGEAATPVIFAVLSGAVGVTGAVSAGGEANLSSSTVEGVLEKMFDEVDDRRTELELREDALVRALSKDDERVDENKPTLSPRRPRMADGYGDLAPKHSGDLLVADLATLRYFAREKLPRMATDFADANGSVADAAGAGGSTALGDVHAPLHDLCTRLQRISARTSINVFDAADVVEAATTDFARQDGVTGADLKKELRAVEHVDTAADEYTPADRKTAIMPPKPGHHDPYPAHLARPGHA